MPHTGMVWYIPSRSSLDACLQARLGGLLALVGASVRRLAASSTPLAPLVGRNESTGREAWQGQHATKPHACLPWQTQHSQSRAPSSAPRCAGSPLVVGAVEVATPLLTAFSSGSLPRVRPSRQRLSASPSREPLVWQNNSGTKPQSKGCLL